MHKSIEIEAPTLFAYIMFGLAAIFLFYEMALQVSPSVLTEQLMHELHIDAAGLGLLGGVYFYSYTAMQIPAGLLFDHYSMRTLITFAVGICVVGIASFTLTHDVYLAGVGRLLMGVGSAFAFIAVLVVAARCFPNRYFALLVGFAQMLAAFGAMGGEAPLAALISHFGWRETLWALTMSGVVITVLCWMIFRDIKPERIDTTKSPNIGVLRGLKAILCDRQTWLVGLYAFSNWAPITIFTSLWGVPYLMKLYNISTAIAATAIAMTWLGLAIASPIVGWLSDKTGHRNTLLSLCALIGVITSAVIVFINDIPFSFMFFLMFLFGVACSGQILTFAVVRDNNASEVTATAIGFNNMAVVAGGALFQPLVGFLVKHHWAGDTLNGMPVYQAGDYQFALMIVPVCFLVGLFASQFGIRETYCKPRNFG